MTLQARLFGLIALAVCAIVLLAGLAVDTATRSSQELAQLIESDMQPAVALGKINGTLGEIHSRMMGVVLDVYAYAGSRNKLREDRDTLREQWQRFWKTYQRDLAIYEPEEIRLIEAIAEKMPRLEGFLDDVDAAYRADDFSTLARFYNDRWAQVHADFVRPVRQLVPQLEERAAREYAYSRQQAETRTRMTLAIAALAALVVLVAMSTIALRVSRGVRLLRGGLEDLANNRFDRPLPGGGRDELAVMAAALNTTAERLNQDRKDILGLQRRNELLLESVEVGIYGTNLEGEITFVNSAGAEMTGWTVADLVGRPAHLTLHHTHRDGSHYPRSECPLYHTFTDGRIHQADDDLFWRQDGTSFDVRLTSSPVFEDGKVAGAVVVFENFTQRRGFELALKKSHDELVALNRQLEDAQHQLLQSEKMASIGQLAAGVAHEINNPVGFVSSNLGTLKTYCAEMLQLIDAYRSAEDAIADPGLLDRIKELKQALDIDYLQDDLPDLIRESEEGLTRVKKIVQDLKDFSHINESEWQYADLNAGLDSTLNVVWNEVKYKARVDKRYAKLPEVECLIAQLNQVFMNLIVNAVHAIDDSQGMGTITLATGCEGEWVWVEVKDDGRGMSPEVQKRVFEPFFTTKPVGKGTGLGLSLSFNIVQKHGGRIELWSEPGVGTAFKVWVPVRRASTAAPKMDGEGQDARISIGG